MSEKPSQFDFKKTFIDERNIKTLHYSEAKRYLGKKLLNSKMKFNRTYPFKRTCPDDKGDDKGREIQVKTLTTSNKEVERWRRAGELITECLENGKISAFVDDPRQPSQVYIVPYDIWIIPNCPVAGIPLVVQGGEWKTYTRFNGEPYYLLISDLDQIAADFNGETNHQAAPEKPPKKKLKVQFIAERMVELYPQADDIDVFGSEKALISDIMGKTPELKPFHRNTLAKAKIIWRKIIGTSPDAQPE